MRSRKLTLAVAAVLATMAWMGGAGVAQAVFPDFSGCTARDLNRESCIHIQNRSGNMRIKGFNVPMQESLAIRGTLVDNGTSTPTFVPPRGTNGFFSTPFPVPGGLLGIEWIPGTSVLAITELAGTAADVRINVQNLVISVPIKVRLVNPLLGMNCHIGTNSRPVPFTLIPGPTSPPPPNRSISGRPGVGSVRDGKIFYIGNVNVENSFAVPGATECGLGLGLINSLVNLKLGLPSAAGNNSVELTNDVAIGLP
jgi:hypothetical protein